MIYRDDGKLILILPYSLDAIIILLLSFSSSISFASLFRNPRLCNTKYHMNSLITLTNSHFVSAISNETIFEIKTHWIEWPPAIAMQRATLHRTSTESVVYNICMCENFVIVYKLNKSKKATYFVCICFCDDTKFHLFGHFPLLPSRHRCFCFSWLAYVCVCVFHFFILHSSFFSLSFVRPNRIVFCLVTHCQMFHPPKSKIIIMIRAIKLIYQIANETSERRIEKNLAWKYEKTRRTDTRAIENIFIRMGCKLRVLYSIVQCGPCQRWTLRGTI